jgi:Transglycosylase SLT domain/Domain of unknown function (DUF4124)
MNSLQPLVFVNTCLGLLAGTGLRFVVCAGLVMASGLSSANIYSFKDEHGVTHFSNLPHLDKRYKLVYRIPDSWKTRPNAWTPSFPKSVNIDKLVPIIDNAARTHGVDPRLIHAVIRAESGYNERAVSHKGAMGLMQLIPATAERMGVKNISDPVENIFGGARYLALLLKMFNGDKELALAGYNAGEGAVQRYGNRIPPFAETQAYVPKVLTFYNSPELNRFVSAPLPNAGVNGVSANIAQVVPGAKTSQVAASVAKPAMSPVATTMRSGRQPTQGADAVSVAPAPPVVAR